MKNKTIRQIGALAMAAVLAAGVAGCGEATDTVTSTAATEAVEEATTEGSTEGSTEAAEGESKNPFDLTKSDATEGATEASTEGATEDAAEAGTENAETVTSITGVRQRRTLPHKEVSEEAATEEETPDNLVEENYPTSVEEIQVLDSYKGDTVAFKELKSVSEAKVTKKDDTYPDSQEDMENILNGLMTYWANGDMEAVDYLVRMGKYMYLSQQLSGTDDYYYVGEENAAGEPDGTGIAVYADNSYYYGAFKDGLREGQGFWYQIFVKDGAYSKANNGIIGHSYNGAWKDDLPNGKGQEHLDIDTAYLSGRIITNVATEFVDGFYNGDIVATTLEKDEGMTNWIGAAKYGTMVVIDGEYIEKGKEKEVRVLQNVDDENNYYWMLLEENCGQGITGLIQ